MILPVPKYLLIPFVKATGEHAQDIMDEEARQLFDLARGPLFRVKMLQVQNSFKLLITFHHIVWDGSSIGVFNRDLSRYEELMVVLSYNNRFYSSVISKQKPTEDTIPFQYSDYVFWEEDLLRTGLDSQGAYWKKALSGSQYLELPTDYPPISNVPSFGKGDRCKFQLSAEAHQRLAATARSHGTTKFMAVLLAWNLLLHKYTHQVLQKRVSIFKQN